MAKDLRIVRRAFNAGEVSPQFSYRNDTEKHAFACSKLVNFYVSPIGAISRRTGTHLLSCFGALTEHDNIRLVPFEYNRELSYLLAFYTSDLENGQFTLQTQSFSFPQEWTFCFDVPNDYSRQGRLFKKGGFNVVFNSDKSLSVTNGTNILTVGDVCGKTVYVSSDSVRFFLRVGDEGDPITAEGVFSDTDDTPMFFYGARSRGDDWNMALFAKFIYDNTADYRREGDALVGLPKQSLQDSYYHTSVSFSKEGAISNANPPKSLLVKLSVNFADKSNWYTIENGYTQNTADYASESAGRNWGLDWSQASGSPFNYELYHVADLVKIPFEIKAGQRVTFNTGEDFALSSSKGVVAFFINENLSYGENNPAERYPRFGLDGTYLQSAPSGGGFCYGNGGRYILPIAQGASSHDFIAPEAATHLVFVLIGNDMLYDASNNVFLEDSMYAPSAPSMSGAFALKSYLAKTAVAEEAWTSEKTIRMDAYSVDGVPLVKNMQTPFQTGILDTMQFKQAGLWIYFVSPSMSPKRLEFAEGGFKWSEAVSIQPSKNERESVSLSFDGGGRDDVVFKNTTGIISADCDFFTDDMVGSQIKIDYNDNAVRSYKWKAGIGSGAVPVDGKISAIFPAMGTMIIRPEGGIWDGTLILEESIDDGATWLEIGRTTSTQGSSNTDFHREIYSVNSVVRARMLEQNKVSERSGEVIDDCVEGCFFQIYSESTQSAWVEVVSVNTARSAVVKFLNPARAKFESSNVYKSLWSNVHGWPQTVDVHEERLTLAGNKSNPSTVWLSQTNNWDNFRSVSNLDTDPLSYTLASDSGEAISWIVSRSDLMIGLGTSEWSLGSRDAGQSITASIVHASNQSDDGVEFIMPARVANMVVYVRRGNREIGSIAYDFAQDSYNSLSITTMNPEILGTGVKTMFNQLSPRNNVWIVRKDGLCAVFTYDRENNVAAWSRMVFGEGVMSACPLSSGGFRSVFLAVKRNGYLCLERLDPNEMETGNWRDCVPVSGELEIPDAMAVNVRYSSEVETTPIFSEGHIKVCALEFMMLDSYGGKYRLNGYTANGERFENESDWRNIATKSSDLLANPAPKNYRFVGNCDSGFLEECSIEIKTDEPAPFTLCAIAVKAGGF